MLAPNQLAASGPVSPGLGEPEAGRASLLQSPGVNDGFFYPGEELFSVTSSPSWLKAYELSKFRGEL